MASTVVFLAVCAFVHVASVISVDLDPGMVVYCTEEGLALWHRDSVFGGEEFRAKLKNTPVPDISGNVSSVFWSSFGYDLTNITLKDYVQPEVNVSIRNESSSIELTIMIPQMFFEGNVMLSHYIGEWQQYAGNGKFSISISETIVTMEQKTMLVSNLETVKYESVNGTCSVKDIEIVFYDQMSNELLSQIDVQKLKSLAEEELCKSYKFLTETTFNASYHFTQNIYLDKAVLRQLIIHDGYIEVHHRGEVRDTSDNEIFTALSLPMEPMYPKRMKVFRLSTFLFNSYGNMVHKQKLLWYTYTKSDLPKGQESLLNTSCESLNCFGTLFPTAAIDHPNADVELNVSTAKPLTVQITEDEFRLNLTVDVTAYARYQNGNDSALLFYIRQELSGKADITIRNSRVHFMMQHVDSNIAIINSTIGQLNENNLLTVVEQSYQTVMVSAFAYFSQIGFDLGVPPPFTATRSDVQLNNGDVMLMFDYL